MIREEAMKDQEDYAQLAALLEGQRAQVVKERDTLTATNAVLVEALEYYADKFDETSGVGEVAHKILSILDPLTNAAVEVLRAAVEWVEEDHGWEAFEACAPNCKQCKFIEAVRAYNAVKEGK